MAKQFSIAISKLARYAGDPNDIFKKVDQKKVRYGNRAHDSLGRGFDLGWLLIVAGGLVVASFVFWG